MWPVSVFTGFLTWQLFDFSERRIGSNRASCLVSSIHAVGILIFATVAVLEDDQKLAGGLSTPLESTILAASLGYYVSDARISLRLADYEGFVHHLICIFGQIASLVHNRCGYSLMLNMLAGEISTPFLYVFKSEILPKHSALNIASQVIFAFLFLAARMVIAPFLAKDLFESLHAPLLVKVACALLLALSTYWAARIVKEIVDFFRPQVTHEQLLDMKQYHVSS